MAAQQADLLRDGRTGYGEAVGVLVVDMARLMVDERWTSPAKAQIGREVARNIARLLDAARTASCPVVYSRDGLQYFLRGPSLSAVEQGAWAYKLVRPIEANERLPEEAFEIADELRPRSGEVVVKKTKPSAFFASPLESYLNAFRLDTLVVCGMMTSGCVRATVTDAFSYNYRVILPRECLGDPDPQAHEANIRDMGKKMADVVPLDDVVAVLRDRAGEMALSR